jgi:DNA sulfur modification protein DndB
MNENLRIELLGKLASSKEIQSLIKKRKRPVEATIPRELLDSQLEKGWQIDREFKTTVRVRREKSIDVEFEDRVWRLFAQIGFDFMNRDRNFRLPYDLKDLALSQQIDVFAKDEETILLVECKSAEKNKRGDFKKELEAMKGKMNGILKTLKALFPKKKHKVKFIFATHNLAMSEEDTQRLNDIGGVHFNDENVQYFFDLFSQIGSACRYQLLGYIFEGKEIPEMENRVPAVEGKMGGLRYYSFSLEPEKLLKIGYVLHRNKANIAMMPTYQRLIKKGRLKAIHQFIESGGYFPNSVVVSIDVENLRFDPANAQVESTESRAGVLYLPKRYRSVFIIDGQHRLYGYANSKYAQTNTIPVVAFLNVSRDKQVDLFMQINENQKAVSKDLRNTLNADLLWDSPSYADQMKALSSRIAIYLGENRLSPLFDMISIGEDKKHITSQAIHNALKSGGFLGKFKKSKFEEPGLLYNGNLDQTYDKMSKFLNYCFTYVAENVPEEWEKGSEGVLAINKGVFGLIMVVGDILVYLRDVLAFEIRKATAKELFEEVKHYLDSVVVFLLNLDFERKSEMKTAYGDRGSNLYWRLFRKSINDTHPNFFEDEVKEWIQKEEKQFNDSAFQLIRDIETHLKSDFRYRLEDHYGRKWFEKGVPPKFAIKALEDAHNKNREIEDEENEVEPWDCLTIIVYREIALKNWQAIFEKHYTRPGEEKGNVSKDEKTSWMQRLERIRNQNFHSYSVTQEELEFLESIHDWLIKKTVRNRYQAQDQ